MFDALPTLQQAETALGENLTWLDDQLDLHIRQGNRDTLRRLAQLRDAWSDICQAIKKIEAERKAVAAE